ncbi:MAG: hypothetical protein WCY15_01830 [Phenylobacterium sp.]|uniref:Pycsar system effector family protein n=1 Tax=Phenylobacterium sp. TaxID=1871053 RepID=UPI003560774F
MSNVIPLQPTQTGADDPTADDKRNALRGQMLSSTNFYHSGRLAAADAKAASIMAVAGLGIGFLTQRAALSAKTPAEALMQLLWHPSIVLLFAAIVLAVLAQRALRISGPDWVSHLVAGREWRTVADEFLSQSAHDLLATWVGSQSILARIAKRKYRRVNVATALMLAGFALAIAGL